MNVLVNEIENLKNRLQAVAKENTDLRCQLKETMHNLSSTEQSMDAKLKEHNDLLLQYG